MPNPWDPGSARLFASLGFEALARPGVPTVSELAALRFSRISADGAFAIVAISTVAEAAHELRDRGTLRVRDADSRGAVGRP